MKKVIAGLVILSTLFSAKAQVNMYPNLEYGYRNFMLQSHSQFIKGVTNDFLAVGGDSRFMDNDWLIGGVTNNFDVSISGNYYFNYDFLAQELHAKWKDTTIIVNTSYVKRFFLLNANVTHNFVKCPLIDQQGKYFYESLAFDEQTNDSGKVQLLKLRTIKQLKANKSDYLANFSGDYADNLDNKIEYFLVFPDNTFTVVKLTKKSLVSALTKYKEKTTAYFKQNTGFNEDIAAGLIRYINE